MNYNLKKAFIILSAIALLTLFAMNSSARSSGDAGPADQNFPTFPAQPQPFPSLPHPFPTSGPSVTPAPSVSPTPVPTATNVYGYIRNANDTRIPGVYALVQNPYGSRYSSTSDGNGYYVICRVPFGNYTITYSRGGQMIKTLDVVLNRSTQKYNVTVA